MQTHPIVALGGTKGGTGKSVIAISLAAELHRRGYRVLVADGDDRQRTSATWIDVAREQGQSCPELVCVGDDLDRELPLLAAGFDVTLLDLPGRLTRRITHAYGICDLVLVPCGPTAPDLWALSTTLEQIRDVQGVIPHLRASIVITRKPPRTVLARRAREVIEGDPLRGSVPVCRSELHALVPYPESLAAGLGPTTYAPESTAARETNALTVELTRMLGLPRSRPTSRRKRK